MRLIVLLCAALAASAAELAIQVVDPHGATINDATVFLISRTGERHLLTTDRAGACRFTTLAPGEYILQGEAKGFDLSTPQHLTLTNQGTLERKIALGIAAVRSSVVVTASGTVQTTDEVSKAMTVVDGESLDLRGQKSIFESLDEVPGLRVQQLGGPGSTTYLKVRGLRNTDTAVLVDGLRLRDAAGTQADASGALQDLVLANTARIEVLRGTGSSLYGTDATGGVVNIVTGSGGGQTRGSLLFDGGALGSVRGAARLAGGLAQDRIQYSLGTSHWNVMDGIDNSSPARNTSLQGQFAYRLSRIATLTARVFGGDSLGFIRLSPRSVGTLPAKGIIEAMPVSLTEEHRYESGTPLSQLTLGSATFLPAAYNSDSTRAGRFYTGALTLDVHPTDRVGFTAQYQDLGTTRKYGDGPAGPGSQPAGTNVSDYTGSIQTANARLNAALGRFNHIDAGYEYEYEDFQNSLLPPAPTPKFFTEVSQKSNAFYAQDQLSLFDGRLRLAGGYRAQLFSLDVPVFDPLKGAPLAGRTFGAPPTAQTGDLSAAYTIRQSGTKIRAHAGKGYRAPSLYERFGVYFGGTSYSLYGDPSLRPDRSSAIDGGIDQSLWNSRVQLSASYFYTRLNEVIAYDSTGAITPLTDPLGRNGGYRNTGGAMARGVEFHAQAAATRGLQITGGFTYTDSRQRTALVAGVWQTYETPREQYSVSAVQRFSPRVTGFVAYTGSTSYLGSISGRAFQFAGPSRAHAGLSYRHPLGERRALRAYLKGDNLFNQTYFENGFRTPGATFTAGTQYEF